MLKSKLFRLRLCYIDFLSRLALKLFLESANKDAWTDEELAAHIAAVPGAPRSQDKIDDLSGKFVENGILVQEGKEETSPLRFIHLTFQEFLAARGLAKPIEGPEKWNTKVKVGTQQVTTQDLID